jgi:small-conductance mechanosensitive channel
MEIRWTPRRIASSMIRKLWLFVALSLTCAVLSGAGITSAQDQNSPKPLNGSTILNHLNAVIGWYRDVMTESPGSSQPSDTIYRDTAQSLAAQAVRLAFQSSESEAKIIAAQNKSSTPNSGQPSGGNGGQQDFSQMESKVSATIADVQSQIDKLSAEIAKVPASKRQALTDQRERLQGEIELDRAMQESIQKMAVFESSAENGAGLEGSINQLKRSVPEIFGSGGAVANEQKQSTAPAARQPAIANSSGLIGQGWDLYGQIRRIHEIDQLSNETASVRNIVQDVRKPLHDTVVATVQRGRGLASQAENSSSAQTESIRQQFGDLTNQFKQLSDASVPLAQELVVLDQNHSNLYEWRQSMMGEFRSVFQALLVRVVVIAIALALVLVVSEIWRRFTFRYVHDVRRRRQFLILRRFVIGFLIAVVLILGFVSEFSSLATFAGFITAGIAVSLQAVLLSVAAYFFLIGRYGIRVGDRISISGVTGDVVDIGLVRLYVMELAGSGIDPYPTGRIVVLSNSVLFQATTPLFKQIPGTDYTWHEVAVNLAPTANYKLLRDKLLEAVNSVYAKYRDELERQHRAVSQRVAIQLSAPDPQPRIQFSDSGLELEVRYPVNIRNAGAVDDELTGKVIDLISSNSDLKASVVGLPKIRAAVKG